MKIVEFVEKFPDEASCRSDFKEKREEQGFSVKNGKENNTIDLLVKSNGSASIAILERLSAVAQ